MPSLRSKRAILAAALKRSGILSSIERRAARAPGLVVLTYHRIGEPEASPYYRPVFSATAEDFARQVRALRDRYRVLGPDDLPALARGEIPEDRASILFTFDDAYRDEIEIAGPILRDLGVPAVLFVPTGFVDRPRLPWWDRATVLLSRALPGTYEIDDPASCRFVLGPDPQSRASALQAIIRTCWDSADVDHERFAAHLAARVGGIEEENSETDLLFAAWDDVRRWSEWGLSVGAHTVNHPMLGGLSDDRLREELATSRARLEAELGRPVDAMSYTFGGPGSVDPRVRQVAAEVGYRLAFRFDGGVNRSGSIDPLMIRRVGVGSADTTEMVRARVASLLLTGRTRI